MSNNSKPDQPQQEPIAFDWQPPMLERIDVIDAQNGLGSRVDDGGPATS